MTTVASPQNVMILGGGMASLAAAYRLVTMPQADTRFDITLYQIGWRLGGKCASARNFAKHARVEEHGLHVWFGCYANAFAMLRDCYRELGRDGEMESLFTGQTDTPYMEDHGGWKVWPVHFPRKNGILGDASLNSTPSRFFDQVIAFGMSRNRFLLQQVQDFRAFSMASIAPLVTELQQVTDALQRYLAEHPLDPIPTEDELGRIQEELETSRRDLRRLFDASAGALSDSVRRALLEADLAHTAAIGIAVDGVLVNGFDSIDRFDFREWLDRHGAHAETLVCAPVRALYDLCFAYEGGVVDWDHANFAAGAALNTVRAIALDYVDYVVYEMRAGMGDVVVAPIYSFLRSRNVKFEFFHRATRLELAADRSSVAAVHFARQVRLKQEPYQPLAAAPSPLGSAMMNVWPSAPDAAQIVDGGKLEGVDLESKWSGWADVEPDVVKRAGTHFDRIILGISFEESKVVGAELAAIADWKELFDRLQTVQTCSAQLWMTKSIADLGWPFGPVPVDAGPEPLDVWADRSEVLKCEQWPNPRPTSLQYFCGPLEGDYASVPAGDTSVPGRAHDDAEKVTVDWLQRYASAIWPRSADKGKFDWSLLYDMGAGQQEAARIGSQFVRANVSPSERYVLSIAGTTSYRLSAAGSQVSNLFLAGDWTHSSWNAGCVEAAVMTGFNAADALAAAS